VIILDENIVEGQRLLLEAWKIAVRQVGLDIGTKGLKDEQIVVLLRRVRQPTFFTRDLGFYLPALRHQGYARQFLRHALFDTHAKRAGKVIRLAPTGISYWQVRRQKEETVGWEYRC
jgi:hypothetical protein